MYSCLAVLFFYGRFILLQKEITRNLQKTFLRILIIACLYGIAMEIIQKYFIPNRDFDIYDIAADCVGAIGGFHCSETVCYECPDRRMIYY